MNLRCLCLMAAVLVTPVAEAAQRTFVSAGSGSDSNPCTRSAPCRNFAAALAQTDTGGEVIVLDSGGYGAVTINQSVSLIAPTGVYAGITAFSGNAITIDPTLSFATMVLRGLTLNNLGGAIGVDHSGGSGSSFNNLFVESCVVSNFFAGMNLTRTGTFFISDTVVRGAGGGSDWAVIISGASGAPSHAVLLNVAMERNGLGGLVVDNGDVQVNDSTAASTLGGTLEPGIGFHARAASATDVARISLDSCRASHGSGDGFRAGGANGTAVMFVVNSHAFRNTGSGVMASSNGTVRVSNTTSVQNGTGFSQIGTGVFESRGNNNIRGNATDKSGTINTYTE